MAKKAIKKKSLQVPQDKVELEQFVVQIRETIAEIDVIEAEANIEIAELTKKIDELKKKAQIKAKPFKNKVEELAVGVFIFAEGHRTELTEEEKKKTVDFATGDKIRWYFPRPSVVVEDEEVAIAELKRRKLTEFIRTREEVDKEKILKTPERVKKLQSISIEQNEIFAIVPLDLGIELQKGKKKFKKVAL